MSKFNKDYINSPLGLKGLVDQHDRRIKELEAEVLKLRGLVIDQCKINEGLLNIVKAL